MNKNTLENNVKLMIEGILENTKEENIYNYQLLVDKAIQSSGNIDLKDFENFDIMVKYKIEQVLEVMVKKLNPEAEDWVQTDNLTIIYNNYGFISRNLESVIIEKEGSACSADKSRWLINNYRNYLSNNIIPDMTIDTNCYWKPQFGTGEIWMKFITSLISLYYGCPEEYLQISSKLR